MYEFFEDIMSKYKSFFAIGACAVVMVFLAFIGKYIRKLIKEVCLKYIIAHWRRFWYWVTNRAFIVSGRIRFIFTKNITECPQLKDDFETYLKGNDYSDVKGSLSEGGIMIKLSTMQHINLVLTFETGQDFIDAQMDNMMGDDEEGTELKVKLNKIQIRYREFSKVLNMLRQISDNIKQNFIRLVENQASTSQRVFLEVFYRNDCKDDRNIVRSIPLPDNRVSMKKTKDKVEISTTDIDYLIPYFPKYLVKETFKSLMLKIS